MQVRAMSAVAEWPQQAVPATSLDNNGEDAGVAEAAESCSGFLQRESFSTEIIESISSEDLQPTMKICVDGLQSPSTTVKRSAATTLRLLAKNRTNNRALIGESGAVPALIPLLRCSNNPLTQEHAVTASLNLSLHKGNKALITSAGHGPEQANQAAVASSSFLSFPLSSLGSSLSLGSHLLENGGIPVVANELPAASFSWEVGMV